MKIKLGISFIIGIITIAFSQRHEISVFGGIPNLIGDVGKTNYLQPIPTFVATDISVSAGLNYRYNINPRQSIRLNLMYNNISFNDKNALEDYRYNREISGKNKLLEAGLLFEYYFWDINDEHKIKTSPYIFGGVSAFQYDTRKYDYSYELLTDASGNKILPVDPNDFKSNTLITEDKATGFAVNFGIGVKVKFNYNWIFFAEVGFRPTFTDNLDYSNSEPKDVTFSIVDTELLSEPFYTEVINEHKKNVSKTQTGNPITNDWFVVTGIGIGYAFGRPPCYCD